MMSPLITFMLLFGAIAESTDASCGSISTYTATPTLNTFGHTFYSNNEDCIWYIKPSSIYSQGNYYLEIKWTRFNIEGDMPGCSYDSVEIFLTKSYRSIGKYCSGNTGSNLPFNMYSSDGYAKIRFKSDSTNTRYGFIFTFQLRRKSYDYLSSSSLCGYGGTSTSGIFYSSGWPYKYGSNTGYCYRSVYAGSSKNVRIVVMDVNLDSTLSSVCSLSYDYLDVKQSQCLYTSGSSIKSKTTSVGRKYCGTETPKVLTANNRYFYIYFRNELGLTYYKRGFIVGYMMYSGTGASSYYDCPSGISTTSSNVSATVGGIVGGVIFLVIILGIAGCCYRRRHLGGVIVHERFNNAPSHGTVVVNNVTSTSSSMTTSQTKGALVPPPQQQPYCPPQPQNLSAPYPPQQQPMQAPYPPYSQNQGSTPYPPQAQY